MALLMRFKGDVKECKTLSMVYYAATRFYARGIPVYTNMKSCTFAEKVGINDLLADIAVEESKVRFRCGVVMLDEAHVYFGNNVSGGTAGDMLTAFITQAGKRGLVVLYTTHLSGMVGPRIRELTTVTIKTSTPNEGRTAYWDVYDDKAARIAYDAGYDPPDRNLHVLHNAWKWWHTYDCDEPIDPFSMMRALTATRRGKQVIRDLNKYTGEDQEANPEVEKAREEGLRQGRNEALAEDRENTGAAPRSRRRSKPSKMSD